MSVSERLLRIIERVGILFTITFDDTRNETQNESFNRTHLGKCVHVPQIFTYHSNYHSNFHNYFGMFTYCLTLAT